MREFSKRCVLGLNGSPQAEMMLGPYGMMVDSMVNSNSPNTPLTERIEKESRRLDDLTSRYSLFFKTILIGKYSNPKFFRK